MSTLALAATRIERTPSIVVNGADRIVSASTFETLHRRGRYLGEGRWLAPVAGGADDGPRPLVVPTLEALVRDRTILEKVPLPLVIELRRQLAHVLADVDAAIAARQLPPEAPSAPPAGSAVRLKDVARLRGMRPDFLYHRWRNMGGFRDIDGRIKFPAEVIASWPCRDGNGRPVARPRKETTRDEPPG